MSSEAWIMLGILAAMFAVLIWNRFPAWLVFVTTITICMTIGLAPEGDLLAGFANSGVVTVAVLFVVAAGMYSTGAVTLLAHRLIGLPQSIRETQKKIFPPIAVGSAFMNNTPLVAMMIPVIRDLTRSTGLPGTKLYMPLSFASLLGGASTLIGTSVNLIIAGLVLDRYGESLNIFFPSLVGAPVAVLGILFLMFVGTRLLPQQTASDEQDAVKRLYRTVLRVEHDSPLEGNTIKDAGLYASGGYRLIGLRKDDGTEVEVTESLVLHGGDLLEFEAEVDAVPGLWMVIGLIPPISSMPEESPRYAHRLVEVVVSDRALVVGRLVGELPLSDSPYEARIVAIAKAGRAPQGPLADVRVEAGDGAILEVNDAFFFENRREEDFVLIKRLRGYRVQRTDRALAAATITGIMIALAAFGVMSMLNAALLAALAMLLTGCINIRRAFAAVEWDTVVVLGAAIGLEAAVTSSGLSTVIADILGRIGGDNAMVGLAAVFIGAVIMTNVITNAAAAAFMFPIAASLSEALGVSFRPFIVVLMLGCSYAFVNPAAYQTNLMVQKPGSYTFADFVKVGLPLTIVVGVVALLLTPFFYSF